MKWKKENKKGREEMHSFKDSKGRLWVACSECNRGGNGSDKDKCGAGWQFKRFNGSGCFCGELLDKFKPEARNG